MTVKLSLKMAEREREESIMNTSDCMRTVRFNPWRKGCGPTFTLRLYYIGTSDNRIGYRLVMHEHYSKDTDQLNAKSRVRSSILFEGEDFRCSPLHAHDSDECVVALMGFLTLRPGDTDSEYFDKYTDAQMDYRSSHAEYLSYEVSRRFDPEGRM